MTTKTLAFAAGILLASSASVALGATIIGTARSDSVLGTSAADRIEGRAGDDDLAGAAGNDQIWGGVGHDTIQTTGGGDRLYGDAGNDMFSVSDSGRLIDKAWGGPGADYFHLDVGTRGTFLGEAGFDRFVSKGLGPLKLSGGSEPSRYTFFFDTTTPARVTATIIDYKPGIDVVVVDDYGSGKINSQWLARFDANRDGVITRADGVSQRDFSGLGGYVFTTATKNSPAGLQAEMGRVDLWLPGVQRLDIRLN